MYGDYVTGHWSPLRTFHLEKWTVKVCTVPKHEYMLLINASVDPLP